MFEIVSILYTTLKYSDVDIVSGLRYLQDTKMNNFKGDRERWKAINLSFVKV